MSHGFPHLGHTGSLGFTPFGYPVRIALAISGWSGRYSVIVLFLLLERFEIFAADDGLGIDPLFVFDAAAGDTGRFARGFGDNAIHAVHAVLAGGGTGPVPGVDVKEACGDAFFFGIVDFGFHAGADAVVPEDPELVASGEDLTVELDAQGSFFGIVVV